MDNILQALHLLRKQNKGIDSKMDLNWRHEDKLTVKMNTLEEEFTER